MRTLLFSLMLLSTACGGRTADAPIYHDTRFALRNAASGSRECDVQWTWTNPEGIERADRMPIPPNTPILANSVHESSSLIQDGSDVTMRVACWQRPPAHFPRTEGKRTMHVNQPGCLLTAVYHDGGEFTFEQVGCPEPKQ